MSLVQVRCLLEAHPHIVVPSELLLDILQQEKEQEVQRTTVEPSTA